MLLTIFLVLAVLCLLGFVGHVGGTLILTMLIIAAIMLLVFNLFTGHRRVV